MTAPRPAKTALTTTTTTTTTTTMHIIHTKEARGGTSHVHHSIKAIITIFLSIRILSNLL
jgi:hypothetical protein